MSVPWRDLLMLGGLILAFLAMTAAIYAVPVVARKIALRGTDGEGGEE